jgi:CxxC-x17-CxxC domain-containing protein
MDLYRSKHSDKPSNRDSSSNDKPSRSFRNSGDRDDRGGRDDRGSRYSNNDRGSRYSRDDRNSRDGGDREQTTVTCSDCNVECTVPFVPRSNKPVYCSDCFRKYKPDEPRDDRGGRDDRGSRSSYGRDSSRSNSRPSSGRSDKFLRKQESFYSGGSAKFNESLQKKLYEILGGKKCSSCGSSDEQSLGICDANNNQISADTGRGSTAGSWGKYISAPDTAKKELKVFCSNCNDSVKPTPKPRDDRPKSKRSKYFSR